MNYNVPLWTGTPTLKKQNLFISTSTDAPIIGITDGNAVFMPTFYPNITFSTIKFVDSAELFSDTLYAYDNELFLNGRPIISTLSTSVLDWSKYPAVTDVELHNYSINDVNSINVKNIGSPGDSMNITSDTYWEYTNLNGIGTIDIETLSNADNSFINVATDMTFGNNNIYSINSADISNITVSSIFTGFLSLSTIGGVYGKYLNTTLSNLSNASTTTDKLSNWANYSAVSNVNFAGHDINNAVNGNITNVNTNLLYVNNGANFNGNTNNFFMNQNINTGDSSTHNLPNMNQYFCNVKLAVNGFDLESPLNDFTYNTCQFLMNTDGLVVPTGKIQLLSCNYRAYVPSTTPPFIQNFDYRGRMYMGTTGNGANAYMRFNYDAVEKIPNTSALIEINADSEFASIFGLLGPSRITTTGGVIQSLGTFSNQMYAGYASILAPFGFNVVCGFDQWAPFGFGGGGIQTLITNGHGLGARTDVVATNDDVDSQIRTEVNLYCQDAEYIYTSGDLYIGYGGEYPRYGKNKPQHVHIHEVQEIVGRTDNGDIGANIINVNSIQGYTSNSFIKNIQYLIGYSSNFMFPNQFVNVPVSTFSTIQYFDRNISSINFSTFNASTFSTISISTMLFSTTTFVSSLLYNEKNVSSLTSTIKGFNEIQGNYIMGVSTTLSSFNYMGNIADFSQLYVSDIQGNYASNVSTQIGTLEAFSTTMTTIDNWANYPAINDVNIAGYKIYNVDSLSFTNTNIAENHDISGNFFTDIQNRARVIDVFDISGNIPTLSFTTATTSNYIRTDGTYLEHSLPIAISDLSGNMNSIIYTGTDGSTHIGNNNYAPTVFDTGIIQFGVGYAGGLVNNSICVVDNSGASNIFISEPLFLNQGIINFRDLVVGNTNIGQLGFVDNFIATSNDVMISAPGTLQFYDGIDLSNNVSLNISTIDTHRVFNFNSALNIADGIKFSDYYNDLSGYIVYNNGDFKINQTLDMSQMNVKNVNIVHTDNIVSRDGVMDISVKNNLNMCNTDLKNVGNINVAGSVINTTGTGELDNFPTWVLMNANFPNATFATLNTGNGRLSFVYNGASSNDFAYTSDLNFTTFPFSSNFTANKTIGASAFSNVFSNASLALNGSYRVSYSFTGLAHVTSAFYIKTTLIRNSDSHPIFSQSNDGSIVSAPYFGNQGICLASNAGTYTLLVSLSNYQGGANTIVLSNGMVSLEKLSI